MRYLLAISVLFFTSNLLTQVSIDYTWENFLPHYNLHLIEHSPTKIYSSNGTTILVYDKEDKSVEELSRINGLNEADITILKYFNSWDILFIGYSNGNIDIIKNNSIKNIPYIKNNTIPYAKKINHFSKVKNRVFISTAYGISVFNPNTSLIENSYYLGLNNNYLTVNGTVLANDTLFAATNFGVYKADYYSNLNDFNNWVLQNQIPIDKYNTIEAVNNSVYVNYDGVNWDEDTTYQYQSGSWTKFNLLAGNNTTQLNYSGNQLIAVHPYYADVFNNNGNKTFQIDLVNGYAIEPRQIEFENDKFYIASANLGLVEVDTNKVGWTYIKKGPNTNKAASIDYANNKLYVAPGTITSSWANTWTRAEIYIYENNTWTAINNDNEPTFDTIRDIAEIVVNPYNKNQVLAGSWFRGLIELNNAQLSQVYTPQNSSIQSTNGFYWYGIAGIDVDKQKNIWISNAKVTFQLHAKTPNNQWYRFYLGNYLLPKDPVSKVLAHSNSPLIWTLVPKKGNIIIYDYNNTLADTTDDNTLMLDHSLTNGNIPGQNIYDIIEDSLKHIWVCTNEGIGVFTTPEQVFNPSYSNCIKPIAGNGLPLLYNEQVQCVALDHLNRKWFGTTNGIYLTNATGTKILTHFNYQNSPLLSSDIKDLVYSKSSNSLFIATAKGLMQMTIHEAYSPTNITEINIYPNPVKPNYQGSIIIDGLGINTNVKITNINGDIVYEGFSISNKIEWNGNDFNGNRVSSGVYLIFANSNTSNQKATAKILFLN